MEAALILEDSIVLAIQASIRGRIIDYSSVISNSITIAVNEAWVVPDTTAAIPIKA